ncbi:MAG: hypothetical protein CHACPFDD_00314 [Phycisphaerae bacterium]|nr:hypothetical protein [Phycisphaerae bacterium]
MLKRRFSQDWLAAEGRRRRLTPSQAKHRESGVWQRRFWEHVIRDERELFAYRDYVHLNSVKHGLVSHPHDWKWSSVHRHLRDGWLTPDWTAAPPVSVDVRGEVR